MQQNIFFFLQNKKNTQYLYGNLSFAEALSLFRDAGYTATPVIDFQGHYLGSITEGDFLYYIADHPDLCHEDVLELEISEIVRKDFMPAVSSSVSMNELFQQSLEQNYVPVVDDRNIFIGIVTRKTIISYLMKEASLHKDNYFYNQETKETINPFLHVR